MVVNTIMLYNFIIDINERINNNTMITCEGNEIAPFINKLNSLFKKAMQAYSEYVIQTRTIPISKTNKHEDV